MTLHLPAQVAPVDYDRVGRLIGSVQNYVLRALCESLRRDPEMTDEQLEDSLATMLQAALRVMPSSLVSRAGLPETRTIGKIWQTPSGRVMAQRLRAPFGDEDMGYSVESVQEILLLGGRNPHYVRPGPHVSRRRVRDAMRLLRGRKVVTCAFGFSPSNSAAFVDAQIEITR